MDMGDCQTRQSDDGGATTDIMNPPTVPSSLSIFHEDILLSILSFVADTPFEMAGHDNPTFGQSSLTHTLPLVSKQFHRLTKQHDIFWENALLRLVKKEHLWEDGMKRFVFDSKCDKIRSDILKRNHNRNRRDKRTRNHQLQQQQTRAEAGATTQTSATSNIENLKSENSDNTAKEEALLKQACDAIEAYPPHNHTASSSGIHQCIYKSIVNHHLRYQGPVFYMPSAIRLGSPYGLHFFEPRYRLLMSEVMAPYPVSARRGERISPMVPSLIPNNSLRHNGDDDDIKADLLNVLEQNQSLLGKYQLPTFIHAHQSPLRKNTPATIVQVRQCMVSRDGSADVYLEPIAYIWIDQVWERTGTGGLYEAQGIRMGKEVSESYEYYRDLPRTIPPYSA
eukprot:CAMPEP_0201692012 /NCGR_PEP_ID=MMETSP0578-20130828/5024_1 /ASSEMBLY_ACC=CAM_ASM_000663 /TAXON_ID=267565 /ORGANISM="Skeletonema grethea, Strain CCMP 1804" /LENGTH=393 /DNA_ID=CAMNT_0048177325 /DNA_START=155 /DNA_END=1332 /DNA_ORIENTATION=+